MIGISITLPESIASRIDSERKDISRSRYIARLLEKVYSTQDGIEEQ